MRAVNPLWFPPISGGIVGCANKCSLRSRGMRALSNPNQPATRPIEPQPKENLPDGVDFFGSKPYWFCATDIEETFNLVTFIHLWYKMYKNERLPSKPHFFDATATSDPDRKQATSKIRAKVNLQPWSSFLVPSFVSFTLTFVLEHHDKRRNGTDMYSGRFLCIVSCQ